ncbi:MAG: DEAD/DEAH box helicase [Anaerolineae bacterium]|nr:DEAD/DEAH box helicase [Thermoflexales bacterium]MDW8407470.1 DEAD/DEAH box helicase [Anaerolineae bacterium]
MSVLDVLAQLRADREFMRDVTAWERAPAQPARHAPFPAGLNAALIEVLKRRNIESPYTHQAQAIASVLEGRHTVIAAGAAGGKSLCFQTPILNALLADATTRALCLFPTKALSQDQFSHLRGLVGDLQSAGALPIVNRQSAIVDVYDGDTPQGKRGDIRRDARIVISNVDMLHLGILPHHTRWAALFKNLRFVVLDEMHLYRGIFGSHVANVLRRLRRLCAFYGAQPVFIFASATTANPREHAESLIEAPVTLIDDDGSPHGERHVLIVNPPIVDAELGLRRSSALVAPQIAARFIDAGAQTICFARSRQDAEVLLTYLREHVGHVDKGVQEHERAGAGERKWRDDSITQSLNPQSSIVNRQSLNPKSQIPNPKSEIMGYRGGYLAEERRAIEAGLRDGRIRGVVATNALELGIDIGELDACVMLGYPGSIASFWQQAGRAGRRRNTSVAVMVAGANPLDQYLAAHPEFLFDQPPEHARLAPDNLGVLAAHVTCATFELPFTRGDRLGNAAVTDLLDALTETGDIHASDIHAGSLSTLPLFSPSHSETSPPAPLTRYTWVGESYPANQISLRGIGERVIIVEPADALGQRQDRLIGETERALAPMRVHRGAIYLHQGETYQIIDLDWEAGRAVARRVEVDYYTDASVVSEVKVLTELGARGHTGWGEIEVTSRATRYRQVQFNTHRTLGWGEIELPEQTLFTTGYSFSVPAEAVNELARAGVIRLPNDYGPSWPKQREAARARDGYRCVICSAPERPGRQHDVHHKKPFRSFGYVRGENERHFEANQLDNLITVCPACHARIETAEATRTALQALSWLVGNLAPLFVLCDAGDLATVGESQNAYTRLPTITVYELAPGGTGLCEELFAHHAELLQTAAQRIRECRCAHGCPACVGPVDESIDDRDLKADTLRLIAAMTDTHSSSASGSV